MAYLSSLVDKVPFSLRSKHLKASWYSKQKKKAQSGTKTTTLDRVLSVINKTKMS